MEKLPQNSLDLIRILDEEYPDIIITKELSPYEQGKLHGAIELIRRLKNLTNEGGDNG